jgi:membrane protein DedA with SNARE-associated domain
MFTIALLIGSCFGPGTLFMIGWMAREEILAIEKHQAAFTAKNIAKWKANGVKAA